VGRGKERARVLGPSLVPRLHSARGDEPWKSLSRLDKWTREFQTVKLSSGRDFETKAVLGVCKGGGIVSQRSRDAGRDRDCFEEGMMLEMGYRTIRRGVEVSMEPIAVDKSRGAIAVLASVLVSLREPNPVDRETGLA